MIDMTKITETVTDTITGAVKQLDVTKLDLTKFDVRNMEMPKFEMPFELPFDLPKFEMPFELPNVDFPKFDLADVKMPEWKLPSFDMPKFEMPEMKLPSFDMPDVDLPAQVDRVADAVRDTAYAGIGAGVIVAGKVRDEVRKLAVKAS